MGHLLSDILRRTILHRGSSTRHFKYGVEQPAEFYDRNFERKSHWKEHYTESHYYPLWTVLADRIRRLNVRHVLDIGCGPGQVACLLRDIGITHYTGLDFSKARIAQARSVCSQFEFHEANVFENNLLESVPYDCVLMTEFLEHIEQDIEVLERVRAGAVLLATVPNYAAAGHVRYFAGVEEVRERYQRLFDHLQVDAILADRNGDTFFMLQGVRSRLAGRA